VELAWGELTERKITHSKRGGRRRRVSEEFSHHKSEYPVYGVWAERDSVTPMRATPRGNDKHGTFDEMYRKKREGEKVLCLSSSCRSEYG